MMEAQKGAVRRANDKAWVESIAEMKARGMSQRQIADHLDISVSMLREALTLAKEQAQQQVRAGIIRMRDQGWPDSRIAVKLDIPLSQVRSVKKENA